MDKMTFKAYSIANEIELNKIALERKVPKRFVWTEPLIIKEKNFKDVIGKLGTKNQSIHIYSFGSVVFINVLQEDEEKLLEYLKSIIPRLDTESWNEYTDSYEVRVGEENEIVLTDEYIIVPKYEEYYTELISSIIAKSIALEKAEDNMDYILDMLKRTIDHLERGKFAFCSRKIANVSSEIIRYEYYTISHKMILNKPDFSFFSNIAERFYDEMGSFFQLNDRYEILKSKTESIEKITAGFYSMSSSSRMLFVEWVIAGLIFLDIIMLMFEYFL